MMKSISSTILLIVILTFFSCGEGGSSTPVSDTGVKKAHAEIQVGSDGLSVEQRNIKNRLEEDNKIGAIKHLYVISAFSGQVILYSTVDGKVTSGGKRLTNSMSLQNGDGGKYFQDFVMPSIRLSNP